MTADQRSTGLVCGARGGDEATEHRLSFLRAEDRGSRVESLADSPSIQEVHGQTAEAQVLVSTSWKVCRSISSINPISGAVFLLNYFPNFAQPKGSERLGAVFRVYQTLIASNT